MKYPQTYVIIVLAATTVGGAIFAWSQYRELVELRAAAMNRDERADMQKRVWDLEKLNRTLQDQIAANRDPNADMENLLTDNAGERPPGGRRERGDGRDGRGRGDPRDRGVQQAVALRELMSKPEVQAMISVQQKAAIEARYASLFKNLNLPPEQVEKLKNLLAERSTTMMDVMSAARDQGIDPRENQDAFRKMIADAQNEINQSIKATIGESAFAQLTTYEQTIPQRNLVNDLGSRLSYTSTPLTSTQAEQLVQILAANAPQRQSANFNPASGQSQPGDQPPGGRGPGGFGGRGGDMGGMALGALGGPGAGMIMGALDGGGRGSGGQATVTTAAVNQAQTVLAAPQLAALQQIQQQQQTQQQLRQLVSETLTANQPQPTKGGSTSGAASGATPGGATPPRRKGGPGGG